MDQGEGAFFIGFGVHEGECVVVLEHEGGDVEPPDVEHGGVDYVGE